MRTPKTNEKLGFKATYSTCLNCKNCQGDGYKLEYSEKATGVVATLYVPNGDREKGLHTLDTLRRWLHLRTLDKEQLIDLLTKDKHGEVEDDEDFSADVEELE